jgi:hypothetical protein
MKKKPCEHAQKKIAVCPYWLHPAHCVKCGEEFTMTQIRRALHLTYGKPKKGSK